MEITRLVSYSQRCPGIDPAQFLAAGAGTRSASTGSTTMTVYAGFGIAAELTAWGEDRFQTIRSKARDLFRDVVLLNDDDCRRAPALVRRLLLPQRLHHREYVGSLRAGLFRAAALPTDAGRTARRG